METRKWKTIRKWDYSQGLSSPPLHNSFVVFSLQISFNSMLLCTHGSNIYSPVSFSLNCRVSIKDQLGLLSQSQKIQEREFNSAWIRQPPSIQTSERRWVSWSNYRGYLPVWHNYKKWQYKWQQLNELWPLLKPQGFQRYHLVFLSSLQGSTAVQPDPQITDKCLLCSLPVGCLGRRKKALCCYQIGIYFWFLLSSLQEGSRQESCLETGRTRQYTKMSLNHEYRGRGETQSW